MTLQDLLQYQGVVDGAFPRRGFGELNLVTLNLGYMDPSSRLIVKTLNADSFQRLPFLRAVYSYDLSLTDFYSKCGNKFVDHLNLQVQGCAEHLIPNDTSNFMPRLPYMCHTPYYTNTSDYVDGRDATLTRLHILDWVFNETIYIQNVTMGINNGTDLNQSYNYTVPVSQVGPCLGVDGGPARGGILGKAQNE